MNTLELIDNIRNYEYDIYLQIKSLVIYKFKDNNELKTAVTLWNHNKTNALQLYGDISNWDVSNITDMRRIFCNSKFNDDISYWDVSNVTDMSDMCGFSSFNCNFSNWDEL